MTFTDMKSRLQRVERNNKRPEGSDACVWLSDALLHAPRRCSGSKQVAADHFFNGQEPKPQYAAAGHSGLLRERADPRAEHVNFTELISRRYKAFMLGKKVTRQEEEVVEQREARKNLLIQQVKKSST